MTDLLPSDVLRRMLKQMEMALDQYCDIDSGDPEFREMWKRDPVELLHFLDFQADNVQVVIRSWLKDAPR